MQLSSFKRAHNSIRAAKESVCMCVSSLSNFCRRCVGPNTICTKELLHQCAVDHTYVSRRSELLEGNGFYHQGLNNCLNSVAEQKLGCRWKPDKCAAGRRTVDCIDWHPMVHCCSGWSQVMGICTSKSGASTTVTL